MIDIVKSALNKAAKENIACTIEFDNGVFTTHDQFSYPDICEIHSTIDPDKFSIGRRVYNQSLPFQLVGFIDLDAFDYTRTLEITKNSVRIGVVFIKFDKNIWS